MGSFIYRIAFDRRVSSVCLYSDRKGRRRLWCMHAFCGCTGAQRAASLQTSAQWGAIAFCSWTGAPRAASLQNSVSDPYHIYPAPIYAARRAVRGFFGNRICGAPYLVATLVPIRGCHADALYRNLVDCLSSSLCCSCRHVDNIRT